LKLLHYQNGFGVKVTYEIATSLQRITAFIIDLISYFIIGLLLIYLCFLFCDKEIIGFIILIFLFFLPLVAEVYFDGQSLGKRLLGLTVISLDGKSCNFTTYFTRYVLKLTEILLTFGLMPALLIYYTKYGQSLGDKFAGTTVVLKRNIPNFSLQEIANLSKSNSPVFKYPQVKRMREKDILVIKNLLNEKPSKPRNLIINQVAAKVKVLLKIEDKSDGDELFLTKILTDYILLTR